jgi:hypothetical protein
MSQHEKKPTPQKIIDMLGVVRMYASPKDLDARTNIVHCFEKIYEIAGEIQSMLAVTAAGESAEVALRKVDLGSYTIVPGRYTVDRPMTVKDFVACVGVGIYFEPLPSDGKETADER